jgi:pyruvate-formate lyase-activating enzyme
VSGIGGEAIPAPWIGPRGERMERLELHLTYHCPERCSFCSEEHRMRRFSRFPVTFARVATVLRTHAARGVTSVHFTGGEPSIHPRFLDVLRLAKKLGMRSSVGTIGTMLCQKDFARSALPLLDEALFSLHGPDAATHDALAGREGSWDRVTRAITLCRTLSPGFAAHVNTVVTRQNIERLPETVALAARLGADLVVVSNTTPEGAAYDRYEDLAPTLDELARVLPTVPKAAGDALVRFFGVPMCLLGEHATLSNDLHWDPRVTVEWASRPGAVLFEDVYTWTPARKRVQVGACNGCALRGVCAGVFDRYAELWSTERLRAVGPASRDQAAQ